MKQNGQWLSHVRTRSNTALARSRPSGAPAALSTVTRCSRPPRRTSSSTRGSSAWIWYRMTSRTISPLSVSSSSPGRSPAAAAGEPGATATTRAVDMGQVYGKALATLDHMPVEKVLLAQPRGFCAGVEMAIKALSWMVRVLEPPVYCYHEIVHNRLVVDRFRELGVVFVDDVDEVPEGAPLMLSAHGSAPEVVVAARGRDRFVVNAVCPLVTKVHHEAKVRAGKGYTVLYVGHAGHDEAVGTLAVAPESLHRVADPEKVALLAQTTLALHDWQGITDRARGEFPELWTATRNDLCFATT